MSFYKVCSFKNQKAMFYWTIYYNWFLNLNEEKNYEEKKYELGIFGEFSWFDIILKIGFHSIGQLMTIQQ